MKIGILTFHRSINYGAFMQCYSLSKRLQADFPNDTVEVIDYTSGKIMQQYNNEILQAPQPLSLLLEQRRNAFLSVYEALPMSSEQLLGDDCAEVAAHLNKTYDVVVVGSDAVWNWITRGFPNPYFLKDYHGIKLSYAASCHGQKFRQMSDEQKQYLKEAFSDFSYLGVRDTTTEQMLAYVDPALKVSHNCDPTMLLDVAALPCDTEVLRRKLSSKGVDFSRPLIGMMGYEHRIGRELKRHFGNRVQLIALYCPNRWADVYLNDLTPFEWASVFSLFAATVTHFFHGTLLSLVNGTPVFPVEHKTPYSMQYMTKIQDVLERLDLTSWRYEPLGCNRNFFQKVCNKLGFSVDTKLWSSICSEIENIIDGKKTDILSRVRTEAQSYEDFRTALQACLHR